MAHQASHPLFVNEAAFTAYLETHARPTTGRILADIPHNVHEANLVLPLLLRLLRQTFVDGEIMQGVERQRGDLLMEAATNPDWRTVIATLLDWADDEIAAYRERKAE